MNDHIMRKFKENEIQEEIVIPPVDLLSLFLGGSPLVLSGEAGRFQFREGILGSYLSETAMYIDSPVVSRRHCLVWQENGCYFLKDLETTNGTWVNGRRLKPGEAVAVNAGDCLRIANLEFILTEEAAVNE